MEGLANAYKESGWLPEWASPGHRDCMIGSNSASLIADAYNKGIRGYDIETLYQAIIKNTKAQDLYLLLDGWGQIIIIILVMFLITLVLMRMQHEHSSMPMPIFVSGRLQRKQANPRMKLISMQREQ
jgi:hypothetical protein